MGCVGGPGASVSGLALTSSIKLTAPDGYSHQHQSCSLSPPLIFFSEALRQVEGEWDTGRGKAKGAGEKGMIQGRGKMRGEAKG